MTDSARNGRIVTFYSFKGGTGRTMALANVGWILAATGRRVLLIDWDLEAPGLHRYLHPFIKDDKELTSTPGLIDFFVDFSTAARIAHADTSSDETWYEVFASLVRYALPVGGGFDNVLLEFVPAGRQDGGYGVLVASFNWPEFYDKLGGGVFLEALKRRLRHDYDFVLIDSRTGISDTAGICTVQMPDELVVLYTLNHQSIKGAAAVVEAADRLRRKSTGEPGLRIWPVPTRVELDEKDRLDAAHDVSRRTFERYIGHLPRPERSRYWERIQVLYQAYYAYEEVLATFADKARTPNSMLSTMEKLASLLARERVELPRMAEDVRLAAKRAFERPLRQSEGTASERQRVAYVSYSHADSEAVLAVLEGLKSDGIGLWYDRAQLRAGDLWQETIVQAITNSAAVLVFIGPGQVGDWRRHELLLAREKRVPLIPVLLPGAKIADMPQELRNLNAAVMDPSSPERFHASVARLAHDVAHVLGTRREHAGLPNDPDDPQSGRWGQKPAHSGRELVAAVRPVSDDFFEVTLEVHSTSLRPLEGDVDFHLHPSFAKEMQTVSVVDGRAVLKLLCWGAFTVGAVADSGQTTLELDLAANSEFPRTFTER